jgi:Prokaryotic phospholipase A2
VVTDPAALHEFARVNEAAATALESIVFPTIGSWHGVAGKMFHDRLAALVKRRNELKDAHVRAASALRTFAGVAEHCQEEMRFRQSQRSHAVDRRARIDIRFRYTTDPVELRQLQHERDVCEHDIREADHAYAQAEHKLLEAEKKGARSIEGLAHLSEIKPLAERIEQLQLKDFIAYKSLVEDGLMPKEGLNWTSDGCSDPKHIVLRPEEPACQQHDFDYRNNDKTRVGRFIDKVNADARLRQDLLEKTVKDATPKSIFDLIVAPVAVPAILITGIAQADAVYLGVTVGGTPDATQTDDKVGTKGKKKKKGAKP